MYLSIDIETTGLDSQNDQILQLAAVLFDNDDVHKCSFFNAFVSYPRYHGNVFALSMNSWILKLLVEGKDQRIVNHESLHYLFEKWLDGQKCYPIGKNFGSFDLQFLKAHDSKFDRMFHYRSIDVGTLYADRNGVPSLKDIPLDKKIEGSFLDSNLHDALWDARCCLYLFQKRLDPSTGRLVGS